MRNELKKVVVNKCYGGYGLSEETLHFLWKHKQPDVLAVMAKWPDKSLMELGYQVEKAVPRDDALLVAAVETLGSEKASDSMAKLEIVEIPSDVDWEIEEYDGSEWVAEAHRTWR